MQSTFTIGELANEFDVTHRTLRFYEDKGLIHPKREGTTRIYSRRDRSRLKLVILGKKVGFSLAAIKEMLEVYDLKDAQVPQLQTALSRFAEQIGVLNRQKRDIEQAIDEMTRTMNVVAGMLRDRQAKQAEQGGGTEMPRQAAA